MHARTRLVAAIAAVLILQGMWLPFLGLVPFTEFSGLGYFILSCMSAGVIVGLHCFEIAIQEDENSSKNKNNIPVERPSRPSRWE